MSLVYTPVKVGERCPKCGCGMSNALQRAEHLIDHPDHPVVGVDVIFEVPSDNPVVVASAVGIYRHQDCHLHEAEACAGQWCPFHNPSDHSLNAATIHIRFDKIVPLVERICHHDDRGGTGHPDPDSLAFFRRTLDPETFANYALGIHGCDGCCG